MWPNIVMWSMIVRHILLMMSLVFMRSEISSDADEVPRTVGLKEIC